MAGALYFDMAVAYGLVYAPSSDGKLYALDAQTGELRWKHSAYANSPAVANGVVYVGINGTAEEATFDALDARDGDVLWKFDLAFPAGSPSVADGLVLVGDAISMHAFSPRRGAIDVASLRPEPKSLMLTGASPFVRKKKADQISST